MLGLMMRTLEHWVVDMESLETNGRESMMVWIKELQKCYKVGVRKTTVVSVINVNNVDFHEHVSIYSLNNNFSSIFLVVLTVLFMCFATHGSYP